MRQKENKQTTHDILIDISKNQAISTEKISSIENHLKILNGQVAKNSSFVDGHKFVYKFIGFGALLIVSILGVLVAW